MHRDFGKYISTHDDRLTFRKWRNGLGLFYGLALLLLVSFVAIQNRSTGLPHQATASAANTMVVVDKGRFH